MAGFVSAIQRQQGHAQALQAHAIRVSVWGEAEGFGRFTRTLTGSRQSAAEAGEIDAALAAFGLRAE